MKKKILEKKNLEKKILEKKFWKKNFGKKNLGNFFFGKHKSKYTEIIPFEKGRMFLSEKIAHYDGEPFDVREELNIEVVPKSLHILVGKK